MYKRQNPGYKLISELWNQRNPTLENFIEIQLPEINIIKKELNLELENISLELIPIPTARWPGGLIIYERNQEILLSEKFSLHILHQNIGLKQIELVQKLIGNIFMIA